MKGEERKEGGEGDGLESNDGKDRERKRAEKTPRAIADKTREVT